VIQECTSSSWKPLSPVSNRDAIASTTARVSSENPNATFFGRSEPSRRGSAITATAPTSGSTSAVVNQGKVIGAPAKVWARCCRALG
jgi:hypothetical protein